MARAKDRKMVGEDKRGQTICKGLTQENGLEKDR